MKKITQFFFLIIFLSPIFLFAQPNKAVLTLRADPEYISPNNDGIQDQLFFYPVLEAPTEARRWKLDIFNGKKRVSRMSGTGLPALIKWDGFDKSGLVMPEGTYIAELSVSGGGFDVSTRYQFFLDTKAPQVRVSVSTPVVDSSFLKKGSLDFTPEYSDESPMDRWQLQILDRTGRTVQTFWSSGTVSHVQWNGTDRETSVLVPPGQYQAVYQAWDKASNESNAARVDFSVNVTVKEMLGRSLKYIQVIESPFGLLVQLEAAELFNLKLKKPTLTEKGKLMLKDVGVLANAYPEIPIQLEGYAKTKNKAGEDRDRASYYAWNVYSFLVKAGNVRASRMTVKGRGRSALFSRRGVEVPFVRNGVEVILEGNREW